MPQQDMILVGVVHGPHGVRGLLKVESLSDNPARYAAGSRLYACMPTRMPEAGRQKPDACGGIQPRLLTVESATPHQGKLLLSFAGIESREEAAELLGAQLMAPPDAAPLPAGQYYHYQLAGLKVYERGVYVGELVEVLSRPANDIYVARTPEGGEVWIPALKAVVKSIDLDEGRMEVEMMMNDER